MNEIVSTLRDDTPALSVLLLFVVGTLADTLTTHTLLTTPGVIEANPVVRYALEQTGVFGLIGLKIILFGMLVGASLYVYPPEDQRRPLLMSGLGCGLIWLAAALWNLHLLLL